MSRNLTSQWLEENWSSLQRECVTYLTHKLPASASYGLIEDHLMSFVERLIRKNSLESHLLEGNTVYPRVLAQWAYRHSLTQFRSWGTDGCMRTTRKARTQYDREGKTRTTLSSHYRMFWVDGPDSGGWDFTDDQEQGPDHAMELQDILHNAESWIRIRFKKERYVTIFRLMMSGHTLAEIEEVIGTSANGYAARIRRTLRENKQAILEGSISQEYIPAELP